MSSLFDEIPSSTVNAPPEYTVSELSLRLKKTVEQNFSFVRVRGELSKVTIAKSGHLYTALKDADAVIDAICWKGTLGRLELQPSEGMEVVCMGRLTTYPGRSNYQLIIETMELAGQGALLRMIEDRKKKLAAEGLFDAHRKRPLPFLPQRVGIITSPTGAVIRDILHRLRERFPRPVLLWPVAVQGARAAGEIIAAINGFNALPEAIKPDLLIVARGGGSLEDLMPFNDEAVVRAAAASMIPLISAVGHETDTTLIDFAADLRAPTPTAAAEKAVPVRSELWALVQDTQHRLQTGVTRRLTQHHLQVKGLARGLPHPRSQIENATQKLDHLSSRLDHSLSAWAEKRQSQLRDLNARLSAPLLKRRVAEHRQSLNQLGDRLDLQSRAALKERTQRLWTLTALLESLSFERALDRGYALVFDEHGAVVSSASAATLGKKVKIQFKDGQRQAQILETSEG